jgi:exopolyphosphatase/guanosine-5'-triphosphate,3'-diphosphate pyrophosphatase
MVGSIARYHRRALPDLKHRHYFVLSPHDRRIVRILSAILRLADGFDSAHRQVVKHVSCKTTPDEIIVRFRADRPAPTELKAATVKSDLMKSAFKRKVSLQRDI